MLSDSRNFLLSAIFLFVISMPQFSFADLISSEDFEGGASGWSNNSTDNTVPAFTEFLGRFTGTSETQSVYKTFSLPGDQLSVVVEFDFYEIDSWDGDNNANDSFVVFIDDNVVVDAYYYHWSDDDDRDPHSTPYADPADIGFNTWNDQQHHFVINVPTTASSIKLGFGSGLDQDLSDESWGIDNVTVSTVFDLPPAEVPVPALSKWGAVLFFVLLMTIGWSAVRRHRA